MDVEETLVHAGGNGEEDDSEWEYEYHDTETESFYVTLDLSSATNQIRTRRSAQHSPSPVPAPAAANATPAANNADNGIGAPNVTAEQEGETPNGNDVIMSNSNDIKEPKDRIQILDLHSPNPIISYQNQIYSCEWTSTIGTDILISRTDPEFPHPVLKQQEGVSIIAATGIKLFGRPAQISARPSASAGNELQQPAISAPDSSTAAAAETPPSKKPKSIHIPESLLTNKARENQAQFLERLIAIKAAKGEKDEVTVFTQKVNQKSGWRSQAKAVEERRASEAQDANSAHAAADSDDNSTPTTSAAPRARAHLRGRAGIGRPRRGNWRRQGPRTQKGGLFRDYRPSLFDTTGADIRAGPSATPTHWDQPPMPETIDNGANVTGTVNTHPHPPHPPQASSPKTAPDATGTPHHSSPANRNQNPQTPPSAPFPPQTQTQAQALPPLSSPAMIPAYTTSASGIEVDVPSLGFAGEETRSGLEVGDEAGGRIGPDAGGFDDGNDGDVNIGANENGNDDVEMEDV